MKALFVFIRRLFSQNKKVLFLTLLYIYLAYSYFRRKKINRLRKLQIKKS